MKDLADWYMGVMKEWCERWTLRACEFMPKTTICQSAGGWGFVKSGTEFTNQTRSKAKIRSSIQATNETNNIAQNFYAIEAVSE